MKQTFDKIADLVYRAINAGLKAEAQLNHYGIFFMLEGSGEDVQSVDIDRKATPEQREKGLKEVESILEPAILKAEQTIARHFAEDVCQRELDEDNLCTENIVVSVSTQVGELCIYIEGYIKSYLHEKYEPSHDRDLPDSYETTRTDTEFIGTLTRIWYEGDEEETPLSFAL